MNVDGISMDRLSGVSDARYRSILSVCDAYESGLGHGLAADALPNVYPENSNEWVAYDIGYAAGLKRRPPGADGLI